MVREAACLLIALCSRVKRSQRPSFHHGCSSSSFASIFSLFPPSSLIDDLFFHAVPSPVSLHPSTSSFFWMCHVTFSIFYCVSSTVVVSVFLSFHRLVFWDHLYTFSNTPFSSLFFPVLIKLPSSQLSRFSHSLISLTSQSFSFLPFGANLCLSLSFIPLCFFPHCLSPPFTPSPHCLSCLSFFFSFCLSCFLFFLASCLF